MRDAYWEVRDLLHVRDAEMRLLRENGTGESEVVAVEAMFDAVKGAVEGLPGGLEEVRCMDVWVGVWGRV